MAVAVAVVALVLSVVAIAIETRSLRRSSVPGLHRAHYLIHLLEVRLLHESLQMELERLRPHLVTEYHGDRLRRLLEKVASSRTQIDTLRTRLEAGRVAFDLAIPADLEQSLSENEKRLEQYRDQALRLRDEILGVPAVTS